MPTISTEGIEGFDSMTAEQKVEALLKVEVPEKVDLSGYIQKSQFDKVSSELAEAKKTLKGKLSEDEAAAAEREAKWAEMEARQWKNLIAYDSMLKTEQTYLISEDVGEWPRGMKALVADIASRIDVEVDSRTVINESYVVEYPNDYTMREILCHIAAAHAGNWIITADGKLLLVPLFTAMPPETYYLIEDSGSAIVFGEDRILV